MTAWAVGSVCDHRLLRPFVTKLIVCHYSQAGPTIFTLSRQHHVASRLAHYSRADAAASPSSARIMSPSSA